MKCRLPAVLLAGMLLAQSAVNGQGVDPYLQAITPHSIVVNWKTDAAVSPVVRLGLSESSLNQQITGTTHVMNDVGYNNNYFYHTVKLHALQPATKYYYRVVSGSDSSRILSFRTLPEPGMPPNSSGKLRFLILGDNQIKAQPRYDSLMVAASRKMAELYGPDFNDSVSFILNLGDQVDVGTLDHYEHVHLQKSRYLSGILPIMVGVGNHETYGTLQMQAYYDHYVLDSMQYKGIYSGREDYYSFQAGNVVIMYMNTENTGGGQLNWVKRVVDSVTADPSVDWLITIGHRPYQAEQYVGDISPWIRNTAVPYIMQSPKFFMHVGAHHHIYARGQMKDVPAYNIISGGTAWDQYWGMAVEKNFDDVQKTISQWAYQLIEVDMNQAKIDVTSYSIGSIYGQRNNMVIDSFHRYKNEPAPEQPMITTIFPDSLELPLTLTASNFQSTSGELLNSSEFEVSLDRNFSVVEKSSYRHFEDLFGRVPGATPDTTMDQNLGVNIGEYTLPVGALPNGRHYVRVRYRDRNLSWSDWSPVDSFDVYNSVLFDPEISMDTNYVAVGNTVNITYSNGSSDPTAWIGIYKKGQEPGTGPGTSTSTSWAYTSGPNGTMSLSLTEPNEYYVAYFQDGGYTEIAERLPFYYGPSVDLSVRSDHYNVGETVTFDYDNAPGLANDWIGVYKVGMTPGPDASLKWSYVSGANGSYSASGLTKGYYFASYLLRDQYFEASPRVYFSVGDTIADLSTDKLLYSPGEYISVSWIDGPGHPKDWLGVYADTADYDDFISYTYIDGQPSGDTTLSGTTIPDQPGNYYIVLFTNDSYDEVSNRVYFQMIDETLPLHLLDFSGRVSGMDHLLSWTVTDESEEEQFLLQHSTDGKQFRTIYQTEARPEAMGKYAYTYEEPAPGTNFYRLSMRDLSGDERFSSIVQIHQDENGENKVSVYPNPLSSGNRSIIESPYPIDQIDITDISGRMIYQAKNINDSRFSLLHQDLPAGTYMIRIHSRKLYTAKLVILP